jgi:transposase-like protein
MAVERMRTCKAVGQLAQELGVTRRCLYKWRRKLDLLEPGEESARPSAGASRQAFVSAGEAQPPVEQLLSPLPAPLLKNNGCGFC